MLYTASFYVPDDWVGQAYRVSRQHPRGRHVQWETLPFFYPERGLLRAYRSGDVDFAGLSEQYRQGLNEKWDTLADFQSWLSEMPNRGDFTLLCFERSGEPCHRQVLAQWLLERVPGLKAGEVR